MHANYPTVFFAYQGIKRSSNANNVDAIRSAIATYNKDTKTKPAMSWEDMTINGQFINKTVIAEIDKADVFGCDLTYLNPNVLFELGYAIAKKKKLFLLLNPSIKNASKNYAKLTILKGIGYSAFSNGSDIETELKNLITTSFPLVLIDEILDYTAIAKDVKNILYIRSQTETQAEMDAYSWLRTSKYTVTYDDSTEVEYRPAKWYLEEIAKSESVIIHMHHFDEYSAETNNAQASLYAGLAYGFSKKVLLLAPAPFDAPMDYEDILIAYTRATDCVESLSNWLMNNIEQTDRDISQTMEHEYNLLKLGIGQETAENEKDELLNYFVETNVYRDALANNRLIILGRKGVGKTALYLVLEQTFSRDSNNFVISLKPESNELLSNSYIALQHENEAQKKSFFIAIWEMVIYSKLLLHISDKINGLNKKEYSLIEDDIRKYCDANDEVLHMHFFEAFGHFARIVHNGNANLLNKYYEDYIIPVVSLVRAYFEHSKYYRIVLLADNLDKTWETKNNLDIQAEMILSLFEVSGVLQKKLKDKNDKKIECSTILCLRKDIFAYIMRVAREPDKLHTSIKEIDWERFPNLLNVMIEKRFSYILGQDEKDASSVWDSYFVMKNPFDLVLTQCIKRPRDVIVFITYLFESAFNNGHMKVSENDFIYASKEYSKFLHQNLIAEMSGDFPLIRDVIDSLESTEEYEYSNLFAKIASIMKHDSETLRLINGLMKNGYLVIENQKRNTFLKDAEAAKIEDEKRNVKLWKFTLFRKEAQIYAIFRYGITTAYTDENFDATGIQSDSSLTF